VVAVSLASIGGSNPYGLVLCIPFREHNSKNDQDE